MSEEEQAAVAKLNEDLDREIEAFLEEIQARSAEEHNRARWGHE